MNLNLLKKEKRTEKTAVEKKISILNKRLDEKKSGSENNYKLLEEVLNNYKSYNSEDLKDFLRMLIKEIPFSEIENEKAFDYEIILNYSEKEYLYIPFYIGSVLNQF